MSKKMIEFVSYDGEYPILCRGTLVIRLKEYVEDFSCDEAEDFDSSVEEKHVEFKEYYLNGILESGGTCGFRNDYAEEYCYQGEWDVNEYNLPDELKPFKEEIKKVVNENVPLGCCGGCL